MGDRYHSGLPPEGMEWYAICPRRNILNLKRSKTMTKHTRSFLFLFLVHTLLFTTWSCNQDDEPGPEGQSQMSAIVSGEQWEAETVGAGLVQGVFAISGIASDGSTISLRISGSGLGQYNSSPGSTNVCVWQPSAGALGYASNAPMGFGQVVVEEVNEQDSLGKNNINSKKPKS